jgi:hypothetical protein
MACAKRCEFAALAVKLAHVLGLPLLETISLSDEHLKRLLSARGFSGGLL